jgi:hypothetical protein
VLAAKNHQVAAYGNHFGQVLLFVWDQVRFLRRVNKDLNFSDMTCIWGNILFYFPIVNFYFSARRPFGQFLPTESGDIDSDKPVHIPGHIVEWLDQIGQQKQQPQTVEAATDSTRPLMSPSNQQQMEKPVARLDFWVKLQRTARGQP